MERNEIVNQILSRVMAKLAEAGETVTGAEDLNLPAEEAEADLKLPGLLILTQEHGEVCHGLLENSKIKEKYHTGCALLEDYQVNLKDYEVVVLFNLTIDAMSKLSSGITDTPYTQMAARALLLGKKLYVPEEEVELLRYPAGEKGTYQCMLNSKLKKLETFGLKICPLASLEAELLGQSSECDRPFAESKGSEEKCSEEKCSSAGGSSQEVKTPKGEKEIEFSKKVITERDVIQAKREGVTVIRLNSKNILTALAKDAAAAAHIQFICR